MVVVVAVVYLSICLSVCRSVCLSDLSGLPVCLPASLKTKLFCETSSIFELDNIRSAAILRDFLNFLNLTTSKTKLLCETSSKTKLFCETSFKNGKLSAELTASYQWVWRFFQSICLNYCPCHEKVMPGHTKCCTCHAKSSQQT